MTSEIFVALCSLIGTALGTFGSTDKEFSEKGIIIYEEYILITEQS